MLAGACGLFSGMMRASWFISTRIITWSLRLHDLLEVVVEHRQRRRTGHRAEAEDAALAERPLLRIVVRAARGVSTFSAASDVGVARSAAERCAFVASGVIAGTLPSGGSTTIDVRRWPSTMIVGVAAVDPEVVVAADVAGGACRPVAADRRRVAVAVARPRRTARCAPLPPSRCAAASASVIDELVRGRAVRGASASRCCTGPAGLDSPRRTESLAPRPRDASLYRPSDSDPQRFADSERGHPESANRGRLSPPRAVECACEPPCSSSILPGERVLSPLPVHQLFDELHALEFHQLRVLLDPPVKRHR